MITFHEIYQRARQAVSILLTGSASTERALSAIDQVIQRDRTLDAKIAAMRTKYPVFEFWFTEAHVNPIEGRWTTVRSAVDNSVVIGDYHVMRDLLVALVKTPQAFNAVMQFYATLPDLLVGAELLKRDAHGGLIVNPDVAKSTDLINLASVALTNRLVDDCGMQDYHKVLRHVAKIFS